MGKRRRRWRQRGRRRRRSTHERRRERERSRERRWGRQRYKKRRRKKTKKSKKKKTKEKRSRKRWIRRLHGRKEEKTVALWKPAEADATCWPVTLLIGHHDITRLGAKRCSWVQMFYHYSSGAKTLYQNSAGCLKDSIGRSQLTPSDVTSLHFLHIVYLLSLMSTSWT